MENEVAEMHMSDCNHCGRCDDVCDQEAVRHDRERVSDEVRANVEKAKYFMRACEKYLGNAKEGQRCLNRMIRHFGKKKMVAEKTIEALESLRNLAEADQSNSS